MRSVGSTVNTNDHHAGYYYNLTGHEPDPTFLSLGNNRTPYATDWPYMGSIVASRRAGHSSLPGAITLPHMPKPQAVHAAGQFAARLGVDHDPLYLDGDRDDPLRFTAPALALGGGVTAERLGNRQELLRTIDGARREFDLYEPTRVWTRQQQRAVSLLTSTGTSDAFDVSREPEKLRERYGETVNGMSLLLARRLVEAGVPFVDRVFGWVAASVHRWRRSAKAPVVGTRTATISLPQGRPAAEFDRGFSALIEDLAQRGLLDETLLLVTSEMGARQRLAIRAVAASAGRGVTIGRIV